MDRCFPSSPLSLLFFLAITLLKIPWSVAYTSHGTAGKLSFQPAEKFIPSTELAAGLHHLNLSSGQRDGLVYIPHSLKAGEAAPVIVFLHGAGGDANSFLTILQQEAEHAGVIIVIPESRFGTWDIIANRGFGPDVAFIDQALKLVASRKLINEKKIAIAGISDGASYALSLGVMNGNVFSHILAFSPGFMRSLVKQGKPKVFIAHGDQDDVLPIAYARRIVAMLRNGGYIVNFEEFVGGHTLLPNIVRNGLRLFLSNDA